MASRVILVSYHELGLKGKNRSLFEQRLIHNIDFQLKASSARPAKKIAGRILVLVDRQSEIEELAKRIALLSGVAHVQVAYQAGRDLTEILALSLRALQEAAVRSRLANPSFRVTGKRSNTDFKMGSQELAARVGGYLFENSDFSVNLTDFDIEIGVTVVEGDCYITSDRIPGIGGLPAGSSKRIISLLSSGLDSPVATWRILRRGAIGVGLHFSGRPMTASTSETLVSEIGKVLESTGGMSRIYTVSFGQIQKEIASIVSPDLRVIMYRRVMIAIAEALAKKIDAKALVTGESLGQVASQTLENIVAVDEVATLPILRPLIGNDKIEIMNEAKRIGTYDISIQSAEDCCTLFMPRAPQTKAKLALVKQGYAELDIERFIDKALSEITFVDFKSRFSLKVKK